MDARRKAVPAPRLTVRRDRGMKCSIIKMIRAFVRFGVKAEWKKLSLVLARHCTRILWVSRPVPGLGWCHGRTAWLACRRASGNVSEGAAQAQGCADVRR
jgi:hypothetical protein